MITLIRRTEFVRHGLLFSTLCLVLSAPVYAFPPAPPHNIAGIVRDEWGNPLAAENAEVIMETSGGVIIRDFIRDIPAEGLNYSLLVPMDSGISADVYKPTALKPLVPFKMKVRIGTTVFLPIEMTGNFAELGLPGKSTRLDLTLGVDSDGDGLPDAWERALIQSLGLSSLSDVNPKDDSDGDGMSNAAEYAAGTYAFDPENGLLLKPVGLREGRPRFEFTAIRGRTYSVLVSSNLREWNPVSFRFDNEERDAPARESFAATDVSLAHIEMADVIPAGAFFKLKVE